MSAEIDMPLFGLTTKSGAGCSTTDLVVPAVFANAKFNFVHKPARLMAAVACIHNSDLGAAWRQAGLITGLGRTTDMYRPTKLLSLERRPDFTLNQRGEKRVNVRCHLYENFLRNI